jgi:RNA polymerase sporulation-specific sigma factor
VGFAWLAALALAALRGLFLLHGYLTGGTAFPHPLSPEEEAEQVRRMRAGDQQARNRLIEHNLRLVAHIVRKFDGCGEDPEDLISIGILGLIKGVATFDPDKGFRLATYAARCIENEILMHLRANRKNRAEVFLEAPIGSDREGNEITLMDVLQDDGEAIPDVVGRKITVGRLVEGLRKLGRRERQVLQLRYGLGTGSEEKTQREIAMQLGISRSYVSRIEKKAVRKLSRELATEQTD